jgi:hypothetical protein
MKNLKITFSKLIGNYYSIDQKMEILNWMLLTGKNYDVRTGKWNVDGVGQKLFKYSANPHNHEFRLPVEREYFSWFFDSIFARAVFESTNNRAIINWRNNEKIFPEKSRIIKCNYDGIDNYELIKEIGTFKGKILKKEYAHPDYKDRKIPKILDINIYTVGNGWIVNYMFSFKKFNYEPGWNFSFGQDANESLKDFFKRVYAYLSNSII